MNNRAFDSEVAGGYFLAPIFCFGLPLMQCDPTEPGNL